MIYCIGRNYVAHIKELGHEHPEEPVIFTKPPVALNTGDPVLFPYPLFSCNVHYEIELVCRLRGAVRNMDQDRASACISEISLGIDFTARDIQKKAIAQGNPWALSKGFAGSAPVGTFIDPDTCGDIQSLAFDLEVNGTKRQRGETGLMIFTVAAIISYLSRFVPIEDGDPLFTGTPAGVGPVAVGDSLVGTLEGRQLLRLEVTDQTT